MKKSLDLIIFDIDGTLYGDNGGVSFFNAEANLLKRRRGLTEEEAWRLFSEKKREMASFIGGTPTNTLTLLYFFEDISFDEFEEEVNRFFDAEGTVQYDSRAAYALERISKIYPLALFTTNNSITAGRILAQLKMSHLIPAERRFTLTTVGRLNLPRREQLSYLKPQLAGFRLILSETGADPARTLMVGDSEISDNRPAEALGMLTYGAATPELLYNLPEWLGIS
jgi:FMN phosphatase YigB (HAD superfamily)